MEWQHRRNRTKAEKKNDEPRSGTDWSFVAAAIAVA
ncbi:hypothetical protein C449_09969 [Halococcus saccharolyticus DSM 5350]|uniref:Uncharacterized protein n=1 Tax=Halococcus saccharolyticus DSM 5350 TaxID=1227455 RepID=M0MKL3_9EURY|nr:hypothetical protein C449_09969 [Halococcus saccharolyticus DSM 5350]